MPVYLLTIESTRRSGAELSVTPAVRVKDLVERAPDLLMPMPGDALELRLPDGRIRPARVASFGVEAWSRDGEIYTVTDPTDPACTLTIGAESAGREPARDAAEELPTGTEVWLASDQHG